MSPERDTTMKRILLIALICSCALIANAQRRGSLNVDQDSRIEKLIKKQQSLYALDSTMSGYRIQIFMEIGNDAVRHAEAVKRQFTSAFPEIPIYLSYEQPYYRLRVGDFRSRIEAEKYLRLIKPQFSVAFVTAESIFPPRALPSVTIDLSEDGEETGDTYED